MADALLLRPLAVVGELFAQAAGAPGADVGRLGEDDFGVAEHVQRALQQDGLLAKVRATAPLPPPPPLRAHRCQCWG